MHHYVEFWQIGSHFVNQCQCCKEDVHMYIRMYQGYIIRYVST